MIINAQVTPTRGARRVVNSSWARNVASHALTAGAERTGLFEVEWNVAADCRSPFTIVMEGKPEGRAFTHPGSPVVRTRNFTFHGDGRDYDKPYAVILHTRCRRCDRCLASRAAQWRMRARLELDLAQRSWFGTLTLAPEHQVRAEYQAARDCAARSVDYWSLSADDKFRYRHAAIGSELTKWLKRIRKESGASLRFCLVAESHKSGAPHYHALIHETNAVPVRERTLRRQWTLGFSKWNVVHETNGAARYVAKYLSKAAEARVRASIRYGRLPE